MTNNYLDILTKTIRENWNQPALTDFYLTNDSTVQDTSRGNHYTYGEMCVNRTPLHYQNHTLHNKISDLVDEFCIDNDMDSEDFDIEEIFDKIMD